MVLKIYSSDKVRSGNRVFCNNYEFISCCHYKHTIFPSNENSAISGGGCIGVSLNKPSYNLHKFYQSE